MRIVADDNIALVRQAFEALGDVEAVPGQALDTEKVKEAELLLTRSGTRINRALLEGSAVRFVASAVIGTDHCDLNYLKENQIPFASAPGSNANSVAEYIIAALLMLAERRAFRLRDQTIGVIGVGNVGSKVVTKCRALGMRVLQNDPPLARRTDAPDLLPIEALMQADILTLHVPLTKDASDPTHHLVDASFLEKVKEGAVLINTSRGPVVDSAALQNALSSGCLSDAILDVWENEPHIAGELMDAVTLITPHVAGHSFDGKVNGTVMIYRAACEFLGRPATWNPAPLLPPPTVKRIVLSGDADDESLLRCAVLTVCDPRRTDDPKMRDMVRHARDPDTLAKWFAGYRRSYPIRREFCNTELVLPRGREVLGQACAALGFKVRTAPPGKHPLPGQK